jgi:electron transfer flavoprotein alpha subunit
MVLSIYNAASAVDTIWVYLEHESGVLAGVSLELLSKGRQLADRMGWNLVGILLGDKIEELADKATAFGVDEIQLGMHPLLEPFTIEAYTKVLYEAVLKGKPSVLLLGATPNGRDLAGRLAVRLRTGLNADCTGLEIERESGVLVSEVSGFGGGVLALIEMGLHRPQMATVRPGVFEAQEMNNSRNVEVIEIPISLEEEKINTKVLEKVTGGGIDISQAQVILAGGRGVAGDFEMLAELADLLPEAEVGATRPPVDEGFIERERQIGQTGVVCSPKVAVCCGISGAFHFIVGVEKADVVIAVNSDPEAEIFQHADYCILGDASEILPKITACLHNSMEAAGA